MGIFFKTNKKEKLYYLQNKNQQWRFHLGIAVVGLAVFSLLFSGCAHFKGSEPTPKTSDPVQANTSTSKVITPGENGATPEGSVVSSDSTASQISQSNPAESSASSSSVPSAANSAPAASSGTGSTTTSDTSSSNDTVLTQPNNSVSSSGSSSENISPTSFEDIPNDFNSISRKEDSSSFKNAGMSADENPIGQPAAGSASSREIPTSPNNNQNQSGAKPQTRVQFRTICE